LIETFLVESWIEHMRQHERVTKADHELQERIAALLLRPPTVTHLIESSRVRQSHANRNSTWTEK
jgi:hypothetical protein